ncbi:MAG TPA: AAA family ATPase [Candidatus Saccharimonadales bacterium]
MNNNTYQLNLKSIRARKARLAKAIGDGGERAAATFAVLLAVGGCYALWSGATVSKHVDFLAIALAAACAMLAAWHRYDLAELPRAAGADMQLDNVLSKEVLAEMREPVTPQSLWRIVSKDFRGHFITNHLLFDRTLAAALPNEPAAMAAVWDHALALAHDTATELDAAILLAALLLSSPQIMHEMAQDKIGEADIHEIVAWLERELAEMRRPKKNFGGIGRDWTSGFTPTLERFGEPISRYVEAAGGSLPFSAHEHLLQGVVSNLAGNMSVAIIGEAGSGKTTFVDLVAERLLEGKAPSLRYYQIIKLSASAIVSAAGGQLEKLMLQLFGEAIHARNIILFLDDAQVFFSNGVGAFDMSQLLQPILQNRRLKIIAAFTPDEWQYLRTHNQALAGSFATVTLEEPSADDVRTVVEVAATTLEMRNPHTLVTYSAVREAIRLSGQYLQEDAYPGKAVGLLEQSLPYSDNGLISAHTVQTALEKMRGLKVAASEAPEANVLLNLESLIHQRMINQTKAVGLVASALRRGRAGVANPKRPVGSFLFLGPTGVGKTELARSLAAVYFGSEKQMIRLDMTEFQAPDDVRRLLAAGSQHERSLLQQIREQPFAVVLLDEIEKAHPNILNLLLQLLDEGRLTDDAGHPASFRSAIIIATSNAGAVDIARQVQTAGNLDGFEKPLIDKLISQGQFKPELVNRFDEVVLFRPLNEQELTQVAGLMLGEVNETLAAQNIRVELTPEALALIAKEGYQPEFGARPMRHIIQKTVENAVAVRILQGQAGPGTTITLDVPDLQATGA